MSLQILPDLEQGTDEWHDQRRGMLTASVVGQLVTTRTLTAIDFGCPECGAAAYAPCVSKRDSKPIATMHPGRASAARDADSPLILEPARDDKSRAILWTLVAERVTGMTEPSFMNDDMIRGVMHEPVAREKYAEVNQVKVDAVGFAVRTFDNKGRLGYSPDGLVGDEGLIEIKCPRAKTHIRTIVSGTVPAYNMAQCQAGLLVTGRSWLDFISFCAGLPLFTVRVLPDPRWQTALTEALEQFERDAEHLMNKYLTAVTDLPQTELVEEMEIVI